MTHTRRIRFSVVALVAAALIVVLYPVAAAIAQGTSVPSVDVVPADTSPNDPNAGQWFFLEVAPGDSSTFRAFVRNPADVAQTVKLYLRDLVFSGDGAAIVEGPQTDVGSWGAAEHDRYDVPAKSQVEARLAITVPKDAEPGDHLGAVVAESQPQAAGQFKVILQSATRFYVTVPGDARRGLTIESVDTEQDSLFFPKRMTVSALIANSGRVRLQMNVTVKGAPAKGPEVLLSRSKEKYLGEVRIPFYGGPVTHPVEAVDAKSGLIRRVNASTFVIPWGLLIFVAIAGLFGWGIKSWWERRASKLAKLQADIKRLESLVTQRPTGPQPRLRPEEEEDDEVGAMLAALKRARRTGSQSSLERLALALHEAGGDALDVLLEALEKAGAERKQALAEAAASYGPAALVSHPRMERLPAELAAQISVYASRDPKAKKTVDPKPKGGPPSSPAQATSDGKGRPPRSKPRPATPGHRPSRKQPRG